MHQFQRAINGKHFIIRFQLICSCDIFSLVYKYWKSNNNRININGCAIYFINLYNKSFLMFLPHSLFTCGCVVVVYIYKVFRVGHKIGFFSYMALYIHNTYREHCTAYGKNWSSLYKKKTYFHRCDFVHHSFTFYVSIYVLRFIKSVAKIYTHFEKLNTIISSS